MRVSLRVSDIDKDKSNCELNMREMRTTRRDVRVYFNACAYVYFMRMGK